MEKRIKMYNPKTGKSKNGFIGFSWPILFLAWIPMFARGDIRSGLELIAVQLGCLAIQSCGFQSFYLIFIVIQVMVSISYNIYYTKGLIRKGFLFNDTDVLNGIGAKTVGISVKNCVFYQNGTSNLDDNSDDIGSRHCSDINNFEDENVDKPISSLAVRKISKLSSSEIQKYGAIFFLTISAVLGYVEYSYTDTIFYVVEIEKKLSLEPTLITTLFSFIYIMTMTIRVKSEIIFCKENRTVGYYISEWILLVLSVLVTAMFFSIFTNSCESDVLSFADIHGITGKHLLLAAVMFSFVGARSLAGFIWIAVIFVGISNAIDADKAMGIFGVIFAICSILGLSLQFIRLYADQFGAMIKSDFMGARTIISGDVAEAKNVAGAIAKQAVNIGMTYVNPEIAIAHNAIGCKQRKKNSPEEKVVDLSDYKNRNNRKRLIHKRK